MKVMQYLLGLVGFLTLSILYNKVDKWLWGLFLIVFILLFLIVGFINKKAFELSHKKCPKCGSKMSKEQRSCTTDPRNAAPVGRNLYVSGTATKHWTVMCCKNCGYEIEMNERRKPTSDE